MILFILGSGGHAREIAAYAARIGRWDVVTFVDDQYNSPDVVSLADYEIVVDDQTESIIGSGTPEIRRRMATQLRGRLATIVAPGASVYGDVGPGSVVAPGALIAPHATLGANVLVNYNATIGHDAEILTLTVVGPNAAVGGWCIIGDGAYIGAGASVRERLCIGAGAVVGMGAVVTKDIPERVTAVGVPARW